MLPLLTFVRPEIAFNNVDFPDPEGPRITTNSPSLIFNETLFSTTNGSSPFSYSLYTFLIIVFIY